MSPIPTTSRSVREAEPASSRRGSVIALVIVFTACLALIIAVLLPYNMTERRITSRTRLSLEALNAADAALEYGAAELIQRFDNKKSFNTSNLTNAPIKALVNRRSTHFPALSTSGNTVLASTVNLWASQVSDSARVLIKADDLNNASDPLKGQVVFVQTVRLLAEATAQNGAGASTSAYATQQIEIRDASLFNYAIFYNLAMEFQPSPNMTVAGPVMGNRDVYLTSGATLKFLSTFATAGKFYAKPSTSGRPSGQDIHFYTGELDTSGQPVTKSIVNPQLSTGQTITGYIDSDLGVTHSPGFSFKDVSQDLWKTNVGDINTPVAPATPPGMNSPTLAHKVIEPPDYGSSAVEVIETQKYGRNAGLYIVVPRNPNLTTRRVSAFSNARNASNYKTAVTAGDGASWLASNADKVLNLPPGTINTQRAMYDKREGEWVNTVDVNVGVLRTAINSDPTTAPAANLITINPGTGATAWDIDHTGNTSLMQADVAETGWNGVVYIDVMAPTQGWTTTSPVPDVGTRTGDQTAVRLLNGSQLPTRAANEGFTVATNAPAYIVGDYNATYNSSHNATTPAADEVPASVAADSINILSNNWVDSTGVLIGDKTSNATSQREASHTEVSAAFLTGIVETTATLGTGGASNTYSGGVENYPRFHENWSGKTLLYRGSIVALFNSTVATGPWTNASYTPPTRNWGFNRMFGEQRRFPPGTPILRTYRRTNYKSLSAAEFAAERANSSLNYTAMQ